MTLYGSYTSPFVRHCRIALVNFQLDCQFVEASHADSAENSPTKKVPYFTDGDITLTDSSSILRHLCDKAGKAFLADSQEQELYSMVNTCLDSTINLFLLSMEGIGTEQSQYLTRQQGRVDSCVAELEKLISARGNQLDNAGYRLACYLDWAVFRKRLDLTGYPALRDFLASAKQDAAFQATAIAADA